MQEIPLATQYYALESQPAIAEDLLNLYVEKLPGEAKSNVIVRSTYGLDESITVGSGPIYAMDNSLPGILYVVSGTQAYRVTYAGGAPTIVDLGSIGSAPAPPTLGSVAQPPVSIAVGILAVVIVNNPNGYTCLHSATTISQITDENFPGAYACAQIDGFFAFIFETELFCSNLLDATTYDALNFAYVDQVPNAMLGLVNHGDELWVLGYLGIQVYYDAGTANFPFAPRSGAFLQQGCRSGASVVELDGSLFWFGTDGVVYRSNGYRATRVSNPAIEEWIRLHGDVDNVEACGFTESGHKFYAMTFLLSANTPARTYVYDTTTQVWHRRSSSADGTAMFRVTRTAQSSTLDLFGDRASGKIYVSDPTTPLEDGVAVARTAMLPPLFAKTLRAFLSRLELQMQIGQAITSGVVQLTYSDDGGTTWSTPASANALTTGSPTSGRVFWTRKGSFRQRILRFQFTDLVALYSVYAEIEGSK